MKKYFKEQEMNGSVMYVEINETEAKNLHKKGIEVYFIKDNEPLKRFEGEFTDEKAFDEKKKKTSRMSKINKLLPFLDDDDIHELVVKILDSDDFEANDLHSLLPFLDDDDCDALFLRAVEKNLDIDPSSIAPFVSDDCLSELVDKFINGEIKNIDINSLYPFLEEDDLRKILKFYMNSEF